MDNKFSYVIENLSLASPGMISLILWTFLMIAGILLMRSMFLYGYGARVVAQDEKELKRKKETLSDLILMKDIQTELEKEVEQAMLKATFQ
jgi:hypothetical protein